MSKPDSSGPVVVYADPFTWPSERKRRAAELVNKAFGFRYRAEPIDELNGKGAIECTQHEQTKGQLLAECIDPLDRLVDGLTVRECLERYTAMQQEPVNYTRWVRDALYKSPPPSHDPLTSAQLAAARLAWSTELRRKQAEARERERRQVVCDEQDEP